MEITPAAQLPASDRIEAAADYLLDREERGLLDGLSNGEMSVLMSDSRRELLDAGYTPDEVDSF
jgi:hypothetical protein